MTETEFYLCGVGVLFAFGIAFFLTPVTKAFAVRVGAVDIPRDARRLHTSPTPRLGGVAVVIAFFVTCALCRVDSHLLAPLAAGGICLCAIGMADDIRPLSPQVKLAGQSLCAAIAVSFGVTVPYISVFGHLVNCEKIGGVLAFLWILLLINAMNLIDGLDTLCSGVCAIACFSLWLIAVCCKEAQDAQAVSILFGACLGFLPHNRHPAGSFIGDTGAMFLGYALAILSVDGLYKTRLVTAFASSIFLFAFPLFDTVFAFVRRILHAQNPFHADRSHLHHRLIARGFTQRQAAKILFLACGIGGVLAVVISAIQFFRIGLALLFVLLYALGNRLSAQPKGENGALRAEKRKM